MTPLADRLADRAFPAGNRRDPWHLLVIDADAAHRRAMIGTLAGCGCTTQVVASASDARACLESGSFDAVLLHARSSRDDTFGVIAGAGLAAVVVISDSAEVNATLEAWGGGADEHLVARPDGDHLRLLPAALERSLAARNAREFTRREPDVLRLVAGMRGLEQRQKLIEGQLAHALRLEAVGTLASGIAHDFNNQLATIMGVLQLAELDLPPANPARALLQEALAATRKGRDIVQRLQQLCQAAQGELAPCSLGAVVADAVQIVRPRVPAHIELITELDPACPSVSGCPEALREVIVQLVGNALEAIGERPGRIALRLTQPASLRDFAARHPEVEARQSICLSVEDDGPARTEAARTRPLDIDLKDGEAGRGSGLEMAALYSTVKRHEGVIIVERTGNAGTTVRIFLPPGEERAAVAAPFAAPRPPDPAASPGRGPKPAPVRRQGAPGSNAPFARSDTRPRR